jgi:hypothetical protein
MRWHTQRRKGQALRVLLHVWVLTLVKLHVGATAYGNGTGIETGPDQGSSLPRARIAIVNERCFHLEVSYSNERGKLCMQAIHV